MTTTSFESDSLNELRAGSLSKITAFVGVIAYIWALVVVWPISEERLHLPADAWYSAITLGAGVVGALILRKWSVTAACWFLVCGVLAGIASLMMIYRTLDMAYLLVVAIIFASLLLGEYATLGAALAAAGFVLWFGPHVLGLGALSPATLRAAGAILITSLGSWMAAHNLYTALAWMWNGYETARANEEKVELRRAELARALHALDEASYRLQRSRDELLIARQQAEEARAMKEHFVTTVSHELRTPLNLIVGFAEMMYLSPETYEGVTWTPDLENDLREMYRAARHLHSLVNDILDLSRIDASRLPMFREWLDVRAVVAEAMETIAPLLRQRGLAYEVHLPKSLPQVLADRTRIRQVLINLLNNAVRFTDAGRVTVEVEQAEDAVVVCVRDTGIGIPPDQLENIFEEFRQVGEEAHRRGGAGLGLALSRQFIMLHGGQIWVESDLGHGSAFHFSLPLPGATPQPAAPRRTPDRRRGDLSYAPIIVVDPDVAVADMLSRYLGDHPIRWVATSEEAEALVASEHPLGIIISEIPGAPPESWLGALGENTERYNVPILRCSLPSAGWLKRAVGLAECLTKPVSREAVQSVVARRLNGHGRVLVVDDNPAFVTLMTRMLQTMPKVHEVIPAYSGSHALRLIRETPTDLVMLDLLMPQMDGFEVLEALHADPDLSKVSVVAVTATSYMEDALMRRGGIFTLTQAAGLTPGMTTELLRLALQVARPDYAGEA